jgi:hypothetical protein
MNKFVSTYNQDFCKVLGVALPPLVPSKIWYDLDKYRKNVQGIKRYLKTNFDASFHICRDKNKSVVVAGEFDDEKELVIIHVWCPMRMDPTQWNHLKSEIIITLMHEYIHNMQFIYAGNIPDLVLLHRESKNTNKEENREYYSTWIEIQAFAHCILMELKNRDPNKPAALGLQQKRSKSITLSRFRRTFDGFDYPMRYLYREVLRWERRYESLNM